MLHAEVCPKSMFGEQFTGNNPLIVSIADAGRHCWYRGLRAGLQTAYH